MSNKIILFFLALVVLVALALGIYRTYNQAAAVNNLNSTDNSEANENSANQNLSQGPAIQITPAAFDWGTVIYGEIAQKTFTIANAGNQPLEILRLSTSCGCTKATMAENDKIIAPGQSAEMSVTFDPAVHQDDMDLGEIVRVVYIKSNDSQKPEAEVELRAKVIKK
ncbi:MAG: DUF1573 domain-containing protein [Patescibacteria group bacterium]